MARSSKWDDVADKAFNRDKKANAPCWICERSIDYSLGRSTNSRGKYNPKAYEPDHFLPVKLRPDLELDLANIRPRHAGCNRARHEKAGLNELGTPTRDWWNER